MEDEALRERLAIQQDQHEELIKVLKQIADNLSSIDDRLEKIFQWLPNAGRGF